MKEPTRYEIPYDAKWFQCTGPNCHVQITMVKTEKGKLMPVTEDGTPHWIDCPDRGRFKRP